MCSWRPAGFRRRRAPSRIDCSRNLSWACYPVFKDRAAILCYLLRASNLTAFRFRPAVRRFLLCFVTACQPLLFTAFQLLLKGLVNRSVLRWRGAPSTFAPATLSIFYFRSSFGSTYSILGRLTARLPAVCRTVFRFGGGGFYVFPLRSVNRLSNFFRLTSSRLGSDAARSIRQPLYSYWRLRPTRLLGIQPTTPPIDIGSSIPVPPPPAAFPAEAGRAE